MGQSTDAILCYGIRVASETIEQFEEGSNDEEFEVAKQENPLGYMTFSGDYVEVDGVAIKLVRHQSSDYPEYIVAVAETTTKAWRGHPKEIVSIGSKPEWADAVSKFCVDNKVKTDGKIGWWLASDWS